MLECNNYYQYIERTRGKVVQKTIKWFSILVSHSKLEEKTKIRIVYPHINFNIRSTIFLWNAFLAVYCTLLNNSYLGIYMYRKQQHKKRKKEGKKEKALSRTRAVLTELLTVKRKKSNVNAFHGNE